MKISFQKLTLAAALAALPAMAQNTPPPAPPPAPAAPVRVPAAVPGKPVPGVQGQPPAALLPAAAAAPDDFKTDKERQSYALGLFFANNLKVPDASAPKPNPVEVLKGLNDILSGGKSIDYGTGANLGSQIRHFEMDVDAEVVSKALFEGMSGATVRLNPIQAQEAIKHLKEEIQRKADVKIQVENAKAEQEAAKFMEANTKAEGVKQAPSGLQYSIHRQGEGKVPAAGEFVILNLQCTLTDGTVVEKSPETGPSRKAFQVLPKGLQEGLALLKVGGKGKLWIPPALGWGDMGRGGQIKAHAVLIYEVEVLGTETMARQAAGVGQPNGVPSPRVLQPARQPVTAVTPPITVEIPPKAGTTQPLPPKPLTPTKPASPSSPAAPAPVPPAVPAKPVAPSSPAAPAPVPPAVPAKPVAPSSPATPTPPVPPAPPATPAPPK